MARDRKHSSAEGGGASPSLSPLSAVDLLASLRDAITRMRAGALQPDAPTVERIATSLESAICETEAQVASMAFEVERQRTIDHARSRRAAHELRERQERAAAKRAREIVAVRARREKEDALLAEANAAMPQE